MGGQRICANICAAFTASNRGIIFAYWRSTRINCGSHIGIPRVLITRARFIFNPSVTIRAFLWGVHKLNVFFAPLDNPIRAAFIFAISFFIFANLFLVLRGAQIFPPIWQIETLKDEQVSVFVFLHGIIYTNGFIRQAFSCLFSRGKKMFVF